MKNLSECLKLSDFEETNYYLLIKNETSRTQILDTRMSKILGIDLGELKLELRVPESSCSLGHMLKILVLSQHFKEARDIDAMERGPNSKLVLTRALGKVTGLQKKAESKEVEVTVTLTQIEEKDWNSLCDEFEQKQSKANRSFSK